MVYQFSFTFVVFVFMLASFSASAAIPEKAVAFFAASSCPAGWKEADYARGRMLLGVNDSADVGATAGTPLANMEDREHAHAFTIGAKIDHKSIAAADGGGNGQGAKKGHYSSSGDTDQAASELPFMQLLACEKEAESGGGAPLPVSTAMFFNDQCPADWTAYPKANGRFLLPLMDGGENGALGGGKMLAPGELREHLHGMSVDIDLDSVEYIAVAGCCNDHLAKAEEVEVKGAGTKTALDVPYVGLMICLKTGVRTPDPAPSGMVAFFPESTACPSGWSPSLTTPGRFLVGLPPGGQVAAAFGGPPLSNLEGRTHEHDFEGKLKTSENKVAVGSGCCAKGYAKNKGYGYKGTSKPVPGGLPYQQVRACSKI